MINMKTKKNYTQRLNLLKKKLEDDAKDPNMDLFISFHNTSEMLSNYVDNEMRKHGLNHTQIGILYNLILDGCRNTPTELSSSILRSKFATSKALDSLEKLGLTKSEKTELKSKVKSDRRLRNVSVTEKGIDFLEKFMPIHLQLASSIMSCLNSSNTKAFKSSLNMIQKKIRNLESSKVKM